MSMIGEYLRVTPAELHRTIQDLTGRGTSLKRPKTLRRSRSLRWPRRVTSFAEDVDWGYGPPRYLRPERVRLAAQDLRATTYTRLISGVDSAELISAEVYPFGWSEPGALERGRQWYDGLTQSAGSGTRGHDPA